MTDDWLDSAAVREAVDAVVRQAIKQYRVDTVAAEKLIRSVMARDKAFCQAAAAAASGARLLRTSAFKNAASAAKKQLYYSLRCYRPSGADEAAATALNELCSLGPALSPANREALARTIAAGHRSTAERLANQDEFYAALFQAVGTPRSLLDVGCGVQPLLFPFDGLGRGVERYVALDKDPQAVEAVEAYSRARADGRLIAVVSNLSSGWPAEAGGCEVALMLKLVGVVERQQRELLDVLAHAPATRWVISGSKVAIAKQRDIERRERGVLHRFVALADRRVLEEFAVGEEFAWVVE